MTVYFAQVGRDPHIGLIKIGTSRNVMKRLFELRMIIRQTLWLLAVMAGDHQQEHALHKRFAHLRHEGEWFFPGPELTGLVCSLPCPGEFITSSGKGGAYRSHAAFTQLNS